MNEALQTPAKPKQRWFPYSLRTLLILATVAAFGPFSSDALARHRGRARNQNGQCGSLDQENTAVANPHAPSARHPPEVVRILKLLPAIPADASYDKIIKMLGLPKDWDGGSVSSTHCNMTWNIAPGYEFELSFDPVSESGKLTLKFTYAGFSAQNKPGFPPHEFHALYPYRTWQGMVSK